MTTTLMPPLPPTAGMPEYAAYPVRYAIGGRAHPLTHAATYADAVQTIERHRQHKETTGNPSYRVPQTIEAEQIAPDDTAIVTLPWSGGTWGGKCGSTRWVQDADRSHALVQQVMAGLSGRIVEPWQSTTARDFVSTSQCWWILGLENEKTVGWDGFRVECQQKNRHDGSCVVQRWAWDARAGLPLADLF